MPRKTYEQRTGASTRAAVILARAYFGPKPIVQEDEDGNVIREWKACEMQTYTQAQIASCLTNKVAVELAETLGTIPPSAIKYAVTKGWLVPNASKTLYRVTMRAAIDLKLPLRFKGQHNGRKIPFLKTVV